MTAEIGCNEGGTDTQGHDVGPMRCGCVGDYVQGENSSSVSTRSVSRP